MDEKILMILSMDEISKITKGLKVALDYVNNKDEIDENLKYEIYSVLQKISYVESEYSNKTEQ